ncbi:hypothetical protein CTEN210_13422 [Chaetoceros tenuissimus]|uniref:Pentatricopeptide repeat-containing protein n=1 Tax=Chaetoceros tenuissimus TaxID=426638 RepID=A0AAD3D3N6_9STRA|nr:hypothetical protein CTEN210_13422 [Chaetoceros tenuissimus]
MFESLFKAATEEKKKPEDEVNHQKKKVKKRKSGKKKSKNETSPKTETIEMKPQKKPTINKVKNDQKYSKKQKAPSPEALELSAKLKQLCQQKNLSEAIKIFNAPSNKALLDGHHLCIMVDLYGRCGNIAQGQKLVDNWNGPINIQTKTALMKGYCHCGALEQAEELYLDMLSCGKSNRRERPNVRTLNTLLRGCLWAAVNINKEKKSEMSGGVVTADSIWPSKTKGTGVMMLPGS